MKTQLVKIGTTSPTIIEPNNPKITYYVLGNSDLVVPQKNTVKIFERKIEGDTYSIYKELAL
ncbi:MAG: hypothetical protein BroJett025_10120 [Patescibacteria group bacterium]|nr:MAG: hypothetical protein BroJett025_10120 [Patescibacteria group bacterium]